ncbi:hypothetical protein ACHOLT_04270 [Desulfitobacterium sp. Sab5]|uniref:hypothetical protein n=1 Tax=Desulfitobacterium nosdiversum TaxID=3375356 RepID=UPI003CF38886
MRALWLIIGVVLSGILWKLSGEFEWRVPEEAEQKVLMWKRKWYSSQIILRVICEVSLDELEQFVWSLKRDLPRIQRELGMPIVLEIESSTLQESIDCLNMDTYASRDVYFSCIFLRFPELHWVNNARS